MEPARLDRLFNLVLGGSVPFHSTGLGKTRFRFATRCCEWVHGPPMHTSRSTASRRWFDLAHLHVRGRGTRLNNVTIKPTKDRQEFTLAVVNLGVLSLLN